MFDFQQKRKLRNIFGSRITQGIILILTFFVLVSAYNRYLIASEMAERRYSVESDVKTLKERRQSLDAQVKYLSNERGIESEMRRQFDIAREGEQVVIILEDDSATETESTNIATSSRPWYKFW